MQKNQKGVELINRPTENDRSDTYITIENPDATSKFNNNVHFHSFYELEFVIDGSGTYEINNISYKAERGTLFLTTPADYHTYSLKSDETLKFYNVQFMSTHINDEIASHLYSYSVPIALEYSDEECDWLIRKFEALKLSFEEKDTMYELEVHNCIENICIGIIRDMDRKNIAAATHPMIKTAIIYVKDHYREPITLEEMARHVGLSGAYFSHKFTEVVGVGFAAYVRQVRVSAAANLLKSTELSIKEICYKTGFFDPNYFSNAFRAHFGCSPRKYREENKTLLAQ